MGIKWDDRCQVSDTQGVSEKHANVIIVIYLFYLLTLKLNEKLIWALYEKVPAWTQAITGDRIIFPSQIKTFQNTNERRDYL